MLGNHLIEEGCHVVHAEGDADLIIAQTAVKSAEEHQTVVVGEDTDLLVLLCFYADTTHQTIFFRSDIRTGM